jgi:phenol hydroxylase P1 protein
MSVDLHTREIQPLRQTFAHVAQYVGDDKPASRYLEATLGAQSTANFHYRPTWDPAHELFDKTRSAVVMADWQSLRDPRQYYYGTWTMARARQQDAIEANYQFIEDRGLVAKMPEAVRSKASKVLIPLRHAAWGGNMNNCSIGAYGYGAMLTAPAMFHAMDQLGVAQYITRLGLTLDEPGALDAGKNDWLKETCWQPLRHYVEDTLVLQDPMEHLVPLGGTSVAMMSAFMPEWHAESSRWVDAVLKIAAAESEANRALIAGWVQAWSDRAQAALMPVAAMALDAGAQGAIDDARTSLNARCKKAGITS